MKIIHVPYCFYPDPVGGTEIYVAGLASEQLRAGHEVMICASGRADAEYSYEGLAVRRFALDPGVRNVADLYGAGDARGAIRFGGILDEECPDVVHLHAFTRGASLRMVQEAKRRGIGTIFSYHTPTTSCLRGTLLHNGETVCDGLLDIQKCASCNLENLGVPQPLNKILGSLPIEMGRSLSEISPAGKLASALRMTEFVDLRHAAFRSLMREVDHVIALCDWTRDLMFRNGVPAEKVSLSRQGVSGAVPRPVVAHQTSKTLRIAFLGRLAPEKGLSVLTAALRSVPEAKVTLDVFGVLQNEANSMGTAAPVDSRIGYRAPLRRDELLSSLQRYDLVAVPSQWMETGPMVVMEAFAAGVPVIGSRLGGIAELVDHDVNGLLIEPRSVQAWASAIAMLSEDRTILRRLRQGIRSQRTMRDAAREIEAIYERLTPVATDRMAVLQ
jgi:glycosyltransferase involved in cell wall biosynthesis